MPTTPLERLNYWRALTTKTLIDAAETPDPDTRAILVSRAAVYECLALEAETKLADAAAPASPDDGF